MKNHIFNDNKLVIASHNEGKVEEIKIMLKPLQIEVLSANDFNLKEPIEDGNTFEKNALIKSSYVCKNTGIPSLSDDSGICFCDLNNEPGIYSARWAGTHGDDQANLEKLLSELKDVSDDKRTAHFTCVAALVMPDGRTHVEEGLFHGQILHAPVGQEGFGYDPIFQPLGMSISSAQMSPQEKDAISHR